MDEEEENIIELLGYFEWKTIDWNNPSKDVDWEKVDEEFKFRKQKFKEFLENLNLEKDLFNLLLEDLYYDFIDFNHKTNEIRDGLWILGFFTKKNPEESNILSEKEFIEILPKIDTKDIKEQISSIEM